ncbi:MAG TPA: FGGY family carbohydrate kinase [Bacillales bacterium]
MAPDKFVMAIDVGTTSVKSLLMDVKGEVRASSSQGYPTYSPRKSWVEQKPLEWWEAVVAAVGELLKKVNPSQIEAVSLSGHMSAPVLIDESGQPVYPSILISDTRSTAQTNYLRERFLERFTALTGNEPLDAFTVSKLLWFKEENPSVLSKTAHLVFPKDFVRYQLTGRVGTDPTDAGNSLLYHDVADNWNWDLIKELQLPAHIFPEITKPTEVFGFITDDVSRLTGLNAGTPVITGAADMACSQIGTGATLKGTLAITLSTSGQVVMRVPSHHEGGIGKVTFHPGVPRDSMYAMGTVFTGGLGVDWVYRLLHENKEKDQQLAELTEKMKEIRPGSNGLLFLPFLVGSGTPHFDPKDRASWLGLSLSQDKALLLHSVLEGISFNILENVEVFQDMGLEVERVHIGAGGSKNPVWCRMIANMLGQNVHTLKNRDGSGMGAAILAGVGIDVFPSIESAVKKVVDVDEVISFDLEKYRKYEGLYGRYKEMYKAINRYYRTVIG